MAHNGSTSDRTLAPQAFLKSARTAAGPGDTIRVDPEYGRTVIEGELGVVIGRDARNLTESNALDAILGYTVTNDISLPDQSPLDSFWTQTKNGDKFSPIGPWIETNFDPSNAVITLLVNGRQMVEASTAQLALNVVELLVYVTRHVTLGPGDVLMTGCPGTMCEIQPGDRFEVKISGLGTLSNRSC
jgi:2-keto-4-pentenoate hydratase/2-oxohepta-3-ene-1,7-dioic acid hydratase in catechol pathway